MRKDFGDYIFKSYFMGGFECSTHRNFQRRRIDVIEATRHDIFAEADYRRLIHFGIRTARDGIRWHLIERAPFRYNFSSAENQVRAAKKTGIQIIWDLFHYGYPDYLDIYSADFPERFAQFSRAFAKFLKKEKIEAPFFCPVNEISFYAFAAGDVAWFHPYSNGRGDEIKRQLVSATILSIEAIREIYPDARFVQSDPAIHITAALRFLDVIEEAENYRQAQFQAFDMICGKRSPELGGNEKYLDIVGVNYYSNNQWDHPSGARILREQPNYRPFNSILSEYFERYKRPIIVAETGIENEARPEWFRYICEETAIARNRGVPIEGICLYPIVNHPGWDDDRHCHNGLWDYPNEAGERLIYAPLANEIKMWMKLESPLAAAAKSKR
jgi:beta-glucosidase/6-phospho-beta-glucosidase/beta-galactosidase